MLPKDTLSIFFFSLSCRRLNILVLLFTAASSCIISVSFFFACISYSVHCCVKTPDQCNLAWSLRINSTMEGKMAGTWVSRSHGHRLINTGAQLPLFSSGRIWAHGMLLFTSRMSFPCSFKPFMNCLHRHTQKCVSMATLNWMELSVKLNLNLTQLQITQAQ